MAFIFKVEDGLGHPDANSFTTVEFADVYMSANPHLAEDWTALSEEGKQKLLVIATRVLNHRFKWYGTRVHPDQALAFPRAGIIHDGVAYPDNIVPIPIQQATVELAMSSAERDWTQANGLGSEFKRLKVDVIQIDYNTDGAAQYGVLPDFVTALLEGFGTEMNSGRPKQGFKRILRS